MVLYAMQTDTKYAHCYAVGYLNGEHRDTIIIRQVSASQPGLHRRITCGGLKTLDTLK